MRTKLLPIVAALASSGCRSEHEATPRAFHQSAPPTHPLTGFWKDGHCDDDFGLFIAPAGDRLYSVSFCGPGGCFEPGTYRPNTPIVGDPAYRVVDARCGESA